MKSIFLHLVFSLLLPALVEGAAPRPLFGTENGYDAGGDEPICFTSTLNASQPLEDLGGIVDPAGDSANDAFTSLGGLEGANKELFKGATADFQLLPSCFTGTDLDVEPLDLVEDRRLETGSNYTFRFTTQVLLSEISDKIPQMGNSTIFCRFLLCDAIEQGFCNPIKDTREFDASLQPSDTDLDADNTDRFESGADKWKYEQGRVLKGISDGPLVLSRWVKWTLREKDKGNDLYRTVVDITLNLPKGIRNGSYFFIGHVVMIFDLGGGVFERIDIADSLPNNVVEVQDPPTILRVSESMKIVVGVASGLFGSFALFCLGYIIYYRKHSVMKLAQTPFLAALAGCCLVGIASAFTFLPTRDLFCNMRGPLSLIPITTAGAIMVARIWRVYVTLSVALNLGRSKKSLNGKPGLELGERLVTCLSTLAHLPFALQMLNPCRKKAALSRRRSMPSLRQSVTTKETVALVAILSFPQAFLQIFVASYYDMLVELEFDSTGTIGRYTCERDEGWASFVGMAIAAATFILAVCVAWVSRQLPSAFNEKDQVFSAASIGACIAVSSVTMITIIDEPTTSPDVEVFLRLTFACGISMVILVMLVWPKIARVMSGEKVVISSLLNASFSSSSLYSSQTREFASLDQAGLPVDKGPNCFRSRITIQKDDPLPRQLEGDICAAEEILRRVTSNWYVSGLL